MNTKQKLRIACAGANITIKDFAKRNNVSDCAIHRLLGGKTKSKKLSAAIDAFVTREFKKLNITIGAKTSEEVSHAA
jgi:transcriptional regulator with XRE-family HTH domain